MSVRDLTKVEYIKTRLRELIYHNRSMATSMKMGTSEQTVMGKQYQCCIMCGNCPEATADWVEEIINSVEDIGKKYLGDTPVIVTTNGKPIHKGKLYGNV